MATLTLSAPAKLNLFLHILGKRSDGYHDLQTYFQLLDYGDQLSFSLSDSLSLSGCPGVATEENLVWRAARALQKHSNGKLGAEIHVEKKLPMGGGIGGGSSDAATTLLALNHLWQLRLTTDELCQLGLRLGADLPIFIHGHSSLAHGIGEQLKPMSLPPKAFLVAWGPDQVSTAHIFQHPDLTHQGLARTIAAAIEQGHNDCQALVARLYPNIAKLLSLLGPKARLTGTGGCVFLPCSNLQQAEDIGRQLPSLYKFFVANGTDRSICHQQFAGFL